MVVSTDTVADVYNKYVPEDLSDGYFLVDVAICISSEMARAKQGEIIQFTTADCSLSSYPSPFGDSGAQSS
jgi:hypothetical protein